MTLPADALDALSHPEDSDRCVRAVQRCQAERLVAAAPHVIRLLEGGADEWLVAACAEALGALGASDAVVPLRQALDVRLDALERPFEDAEVAPEQIGQWAVAVVQERAEISDAAVAIARALGQLGDPRAAASLARGAASERVDARLRDACGAARRGAPAAGASVPVAREPTSVEPESAPETAADFLALATRRARSHDPTFPALDHLPTLVAEDTATCTAHAAWQDGERGANVSLTTEETGPREPIRHERGSATCWGLGWGFTLDFEAAKGEAPRCWLTPFSPARGA